MILAGGYGVIYPLASTIYWTLLGCLAVWILLKAINR
jgi:hypothetical protein